MNLYDSYIDGALELSYSSRIHFYAAVIEYLRDGREPSPKLKGAGKALFLAIRPSLEKQRIQKLNSKPEKPAPKADRPRRAKAVDADKRDQAQSKDVVKTVVETTSKTTAQSPNQVEANFGFGPDYQDTLTTNSMSVYYLGKEELGASESLPGEGDFGVRPSEVDFLESMGFVPPTVEEVRTYCAANMLAHVDADSFCDYYEAQGWVRGNQAKTPIRDWRPLARQWERDNRLKAATEKSREADLSYLDEGWVTVDDLGETA